MTKRLRTAEEPPAMHPGVQQAIDQGKGATVSDPDALLIIRGAIERTVSPTAQGGARHAA